jgi:hypothetical protein
MLTYLYDAPMLSVARVVLMAAAKLKGLIFDKSAVAEKRGQPYPDQLVVLADHVGGSTILKIWRPLQDSNLRPTD